MKLENHCFELLERLILTTLPQLLLDEFCLFGQMKS